MVRRRPIRLALDQNFPTPILRAIAEYIVDVELIPIREIDARLSTLEDRELLIALKQLGYPGLVTNNYKMLKNPKELAAIMATKLTVFAIQGVGHDPIRATGALLLDLPGALKRMDTRKAQVFWMRPRNPTPDDPADLFERAAKHQNRTATELLKSVAVGPDEDLAQTYRRFLEVIEAQLPPSIADEDRLTVAYGLLCIATRPRRSTIWELPTSRCKRLVTRPSWC